MFTHNFFHLFIFSFSSIHNIVPPQITSGPGSINAGMGSSTFLPCQYIGDPVPMVTWYKEETLLDLTPGSTTKYQKTNQGLHINSLGLADSGNYKCVAENKVGSAESVGRLTVESKLLYPIHVTRCKGQLQMCSRE